MRAALLLVTGCTSIFGLDSPTHRSGPDDAALPDDVAIDAPASCPTVVHDEDNDDIDDACDACPTVRSDTSDDDGDGLPDACDPNLATTGDRILFARMFTSPLDTADLDPNNAQQDDEDQGIVYVVDGGRIRTTTSLMPTLIEVRVTSFMGTNPLEVKAPGATCTVRPQPCAGNGVGMCVAISGGPTTAGLDVPSTDLQRVLLAERAGETQCDGITATEMAWASATSVLGNGTLEIKIGLGTFVAVQSLVIYGAK